MKLFQVSLTLRERKRGFHLITGEVIHALPQISEISSGLCQVFMQHTSASLTMNENADPTVRLDFETYFNKVVPENDPGYKHTDEGSDDMPAHLKASLLGSSVLIPIHKGRLALGTWQGIYLCEHRNRGIQGSGDHGLGRIVYFIVEVIVAGVGIAMVYLKLWMYEKDS